MMGPGEAASMFNLLQPGENRRASFTNAGAEVSFRAVNTVEGFFGLVTCFVTADSLVDVGEIVFHIVNGQRQVECLGAVFE
jgi:hypothetical protein